MLINNGAVSTKYYNKVDIQNRPLGFSIQGNGLHNYIYDLPLLSCLKIHMSLQGFCRFLTNYKVPGAKNTGHY